MARDPGGSPTARWIAVAATAVLGVVVIVLAVLAIDRANPDLPAQTANPVPTFTLGVQTPTPTPTPQPPPPAPSAAARELERFLTIGSEAMWRATAGLCGSVEPLVERSGDGGATWTDVTARYLGLGQVASLDAFSARDAEMVAAVGPACETQALRTFTDGEFWASYPDVLAVSRYIDLADPSLVHLGGDGTIAAPCAEARGLRASGDVVALICDDIAYAWRDGGWVPLSSDGVAAVAVSGADIVVARAAEDCSGVALTRFADGAGAGVPVGCTEGADPDAPVALFVTPDSYLLWAGDHLATLH